MGLAQVGLAQVGHDQIKSPGGLGRGFCVAGRGAKFYPLHFPLWPVRSKPGGQQTVAIMHRSAWLSTLELVRILQHSSAGLFFLGLPFCPRGHANQFGDRAARQVR